MSNNNVLNSVLTLAGLKGNFSQLAANTEISRAAYHAMTAGNTRPFEETKAAMPKGLIVDKDATAQNGGVKMFKYANNFQGVVLAAVIAAAVESRRYFEQLKANDGKLNKKLAAADFALAETYAANIAATFAASCENGQKNLKAARDVASEKTKATKASKAAEAVKTQQAEAAKVAEAEAVKAADTLTISEFLLALKGGDKKALATANVIATALQAFHAAEAVKAEKRAAHADKKQAIAA